MILRRVGRLRFVFLFVGRIEIRREGFKLRAARIDALEDRNDAETFAIRARLIFGAPRQVREPSVGKPDLFEVA